MRAFASCLLAAAAAVASTSPAAAGSASAGALPCQRTALGARQEPTGPAAYQSGSLRLANGAVLRFQGSPAALSEARNIAIGDPVAACYGPNRDYADAGRSRTITLLDLRNGAYFGTLVGNWNGVK